MRNLAEVSIEVSRTPDRVGDPASTGVIRIQLSASGEAWVHAYGEGSARLKASTARILLPLLQEIVALDEKGKGSERV